jgi:hypothetical protein
MIQNFFPSNVLDKGEFVFARFDSVGDSVSYPIVQMPLITQANWQGRVITSITCVAENDLLLAFFTPILKATTNLFRQYTIINFAQLVGYTITLKTEKNTAIIADMPLPLLSNFTAQNERLVMQKKTVFNVSLDNSYITRHSDATPLTTSTVIPFYIQYK